MLETFGYVEELHQAVLACREVDPQIPIVAQVTIDEDGNCLDGADPEAFAARLTEWKVDVLGINCSVGPVAMLDAIERVRAATTFPSPRSQMPACPARSRAATFISVRRNTWRTIRENLWRRECSWSADAAGPRPITSAP